MCERRSSDRARDGRPATRRPNVRETVRERARGSREAVEQPIIAAPNQDKSGGAALCHGVGGRVGVSVPSRPWPRCFVRWLPTTHRGRVSETSTKSSLDREEGELCLVSTHPSVDVATLCRLLSA